MKILNISLTNFGSYKKLDFDFSQGLSLISGPTGSGKSTLMDAIPWILYGKTAKGGAVDEVRNWGSKDTTGRVQIEINGQPLLVTRVRGSSNDLWFCSENDHVRGKDIQDTQKLLDARIGIDYGKYILSSYFHEFSSASQFFTASAKQRREIMEELTDLRLAKQTAEGTTDYKKYIKKERENLVLATSGAESQLSFLSKILDRSKEEFISWETNKAHKLKSYKDISSRFEDQKQQNIISIKEKHFRKLAEIDADIADIEAKIVDDSNLQKEQEQIQKDESLLGDEHCSACGAKKDAAKRMFINRRQYALETKRAANIELWKNLTVLRIRREKVSLTLQPALDQENSVDNTYNEQIRAIEQEVNPHSSILQGTEEAKSRETAKLSELKESLKTLTSEYEDADLLQRVSEHFRQAMVSSAVTKLEQSTNRLLSDHYDAELKVTFESGTADKIDTVIYKDGNECGYSQLSKGQRQLLKLCFSVSVMELCSNHNGAESNIMFFDEVADGLDDNFKSKTFNMLQELSTKRDSVFAIDHSEAFKQMFTNRYEVRLINGQSEIKAI